MPIPSSLDGELSSDTQKIVVPAPSSGTRVVWLLTICNKNTSAVTLTVGVYNTTDAAFREIAVVDLDPDETFEFCDDNDERGAVLQSHQQIRAVLAGPALVRQPTFYSSFADWV